MQAWLLYRMRFLIAADLAGAWAGFGGLAAQLNHLAIVMNISITDSVSIALPYGRLVRDFLAERARPRHEMTLGWELPRRLFFGWESGYESSRDGRTPPRGCSSQGIA